MTRVALLACLFLAGCSALPERSDYYETQYRSSQALGGHAPAFERLVALQKAWEKRSEPGLLRCEKKEARALTLAEDAARVVRAREAILSQREVTEVIINALADLESEYDALAALLVESEAPGAVISLVAEQKYLARRMANSLVLMSQTDMTAAVEAADLFGRDVARFQNLLDAAINGNEELGVEPVDNSEVEDSLAQIEELFSGYVADSSSDLLESVAYRYDAWLALGEMESLGDGRKVAAAEAGTTAAATAAGKNEPATGASGADAAADDSAADESANNAAEDAAEDASRNAGVGDDAEAADPEAGMSGEPAADEMGDAGADMNEAGVDVDAGMEDPAAEAGAVDDEIE